MKTNTKSQPGAIAKQADNNWRGFSHYHLKSPPPLMVFVFFFAFFVVDACAIFLSQRGWGGSRARTQVCCLHLVKVACQSKTSQQRIIIKPSCREDRRGTWRGSQIMGHQPTEDTLNVLLPTDTPHSTLISVFLNIFLCVQRCLPKVGH